MIKGGPLGALARLRRAIDRAALMYPEAGRSSRARTAVRVELESALELAREEILDPLYWRSYDQLAGRLTAALEHGEESSVLARRVLGLLNAHLLGRTGRGGRRG